MDAMTTDHPRPTRTRVLAVLAAVVSAVVVWIVVTPVLGMEIVVPAGPDGAEMELGIGPVLVVALGAGLAGWALAAVLHGRVASARRVWTVAAAAVFVLSLVPVFALGLGTGQVVALGLLHAVVAGALIALIPPTLPQRV